MDDTPHSPHSAPTSTSHADPHPLSSHSHSEYLITPQPTTDTAVSAHAVIRLIQCPRCSFPLRSPVRLPCGNTLCRGCLPTIRPRTGVSYPTSEERKQGFTCYWERGECGADHCLGDCGTDVLLTRVVDVFDEVLGDGDAAGSITLRWEQSRSNAEGTHTESAQIGPDLLRDVYEVVKRGQLHYGASGIRYEPPEYIGSVTDDDNSTFAKLKAAVRNELDCQVCYSLILDPLTTSCGHTFCRSCVGMARSHSDLCPICRQKLNMSVMVRSERTNKRISEIIELFLSEEVTSRRADLLPDTDVDDEGTIPLFVNSLAFPTMPIFLHIFEPRYRLMIQRVIESRSRRFGMVMHNRRGRLQRGLGRSPFVQYGTVLVIDRYELLPDGRSLVIATGTSRFKVVSWERVDGYYVGKTQRVDDVSISEEEAQESLETSGVVGSRTSSTEGSLDSKSTQQLFQLALDYVLTERRQGAPWLHPRVLLAYGPLPTDPALFPWWFATIIPILDEEKYALLSATTVRQRLKITARWVRMLESRQWLSHSRGSMSAVL